jgi:hypothetical protein
VAARMFRLATGMVKKRHYYQQSGEFIASAFVTQDVL